MIMEDWIRGVLIFLAGLIAGLIAFLRLTKKGAELRETWQEFDTLNTARKSVTEYKRQNTILEKKVMELAERNRLLEERNALLENEVRDVRAMRKEMAELREKAADNHVKLLQFLVREGKLEEEAVRFAFGTKWEGDGQL